VQLLIIILLVLNFIGVLFLIIRSFFKTKNDSQLELSQKILENQGQLHRQLMEVKAKLEHYYESIQQESEQWRAEKPAFEAPLQADAKPKKEQNLLLNDRYKEIFELKEQGLTADEIAKKLDKGFGEVALILGLAAQVKA
jgi:DNA-binding NarL/FixJ family response regulator